MNIHLIGGWAYATTTWTHVEHLTMHPFHEDLNALSQESDPWCLAGWSLGGLRALEAVANGVIKPNRLILISSTARFCADGDYACGVPRAGLRTMMIGIKRKKSETLQRFFTDALSPDNVDNQQVDARVQQSATFTDEQLLEGLQQLDKLDLRDVLSQVTVPTLILHGARDRIIPVEAAEFMHRSIPNSDCFIHPEAGHEMLFTYSTWVAESVRPFISR